MSKVEFHRDLIVSLAISFWEIGTRKLDREDFCPLPARCPDSERTERFPHLYFDDLFMSWPIFAGYGCRTAAISWRGTFSGY
jgi:hypothetical protein